MESKDKESSMGYLVGIATFVVVWLYLMAELDLVFGLLLGWVPAIIIGFISYHFWPLFLFSLIILLYQWLSSK